MVHHTVSLEVGSTEQISQAMKTVVFNYPKDFKGPRHFKDGDERTVAKETADYFISIGIASAKGDTVGKPHKAKADKC